ncbi:adenylyl-sulfate kinase [Gordonia soli]|uniref:Adenylyl-sulfate kinase n=1 Tax=Gordonia soli NBRC 108243 TaxID=1223545 RepID=M0QKE2_9ACTN|nr:adenylyl-sulfate kinase [Gordonia soli]GAC68904.1 adenylyl-sulfate kinase [Gordonia soli NBRC 108243]
MTDTVPARAGNLAAPAHAADVTAPVQTRRRQLLRMATAGSVDDGKSTLIGRLLFDTDSLPTDHLDAVTDDGGTPDLAALSDGLRAEREQGITIDVAYRFFSTPTRNYILSDTPGHERYTRNMFTGASNAHVAVLLVDARAGVLRQTRRHARIASLLRVPHIVAAVNKIDLVGYEQAEFDRVADELDVLAQRLGIELTVIPVAAKDGDNVVHPSTNTPWYDGPTLLQYLEDIDLAAPKASAEELRLPVQWVSRPGAEYKRRYTGRLSAGAIRVGDEVAVLPAGTRSVVTALDTLDAERTTAVAPLSVSIELADEIDIGRGDVIVSAKADAELPTLGRELVAHVCWFADAPLHAGERLALKHGTSVVRATVGELASRIDPETLTEEQDPIRLDLNDIGVVTIRTSSVVTADEYADNRDGGSFILIDEHSNDTVGAGTILQARAAKPGERVRNDVKWHPSALDRHHRWGKIAQQGATVWLTGLPASGKSTLAVALEQALVERGDAAYLLDGDNVRHGLSDDLGFSPGDRAENIRRVGHLTRLFADAGVIAIASLVSPLESDRAIARELNHAASLDFVEVHVSTPLAECERRDPKRLYARARAGELRGLTGVDAPYEPPRNPDIAVDTTDADTDRLVARILEIIDRRRNQAV